MSDSPHAPLIRKIFAEGSILPAHITVGVLKQNLLMPQVLEAPACLIDGFPRNMDNFSEFEKQVRHGLPTNHATRSLD